MVNKDEPVKSMESDKKHFESDDALNKGEKLKDKKTDKKKNKSVEKGSGKKDQKASEPGIAELKAEIEANKDRILRISAEFENYKKRSAKEMDDFRKFANETLFKQLLTVVDNLERAISSGEECSDAEALLKGIKMTHKEIMKLFETFNVKPVEAHGKPFDPVFHQAVSQQESDEYPENTVINELQKGYTLHDRLLRPSMVVVSKASTSKASAKDDQERKQNQNQKQ